MIRCLTLLQELKNNFISLLLSIQSKRRQHNIDGAPKKRYKFFLLGNKKKQGFGSNFSMYLARQKIESELKE
jgi:hypothetical protein